ncbi:hypothetical protein TNCT_246241 [Trichonephila clavata]|uniref:Uncharacterized protein n=1 Tax=Trichonephila clavata TaxID=2740835 RepID=A0A8X6KEQ8_TRICU|nr:hypothetical protein TNCT_246241 [Trichonephila clavata]
MEHRNEAHTTTDNPSLRRNLPPAAGLPCPSAACDSALFRCCSKNFEVQNLSSSPPLAVVFTTRSSLRLRLDRLATFLRASRELCTNSPRRQGSRHQGPHETAPSSGGPRKISKSKTTPLPVLFFITCNFTSPFDCNSIVFPTRLARTVHKLPPPAGLPYPLAACDSALFRWTSKNFEVQNHSFSPLPALFEPSLASATDSLRASHHFPAPTRIHLSRRQGSRHQGPHETAPSSGAARKISKSKTAPSRLFPFITRSSTRASHPLLPTAGLPSPGPAAHNALFRWT